MRHLALLAVLLGCSAGPSVVVTDPPPLVVEEPGPLTIIRQRKPVEAPKPSPPLIAELPDHEGEPIVAELPPIPLRPDSWLIWARGVKEGLEVASNRQAILDTCPCGPVCNCGPECPCPNCPHESAAPVREFNVIGAEWCGPCVTIHKAAEGVEGVRFLDVDRDTAEVGQLWANERSRFVFMGSNKVPASLPAFVLTIDGEPVKWWYKPATDSRPWNAERIRFLRDFQVPTETGGSQPTHDAQPNDSAKAGDSPAATVSHIQVNCGRGTATGVCVGTRAGESLVLTNHHVYFEPGGVPAGVPSVYLAGQWHAGKLIASDEDADLALISVPCTLRPVAIADAQPAAGSQIRTFGYGGGRHTPRVTVTLAGYPGGGQMVGRTLTQFAFIPGESGSAVMFGDRLVGLVSGRDPSGRFGVVVDLPSIRAFLTRQGVL